MSKKLRWRTLLFAVVFFVLSMSGMLVYANEKAIVITEGQVNTSVMREEQNKKKPLIQEARSFVFDAEASAGERLCVPLKSGVKAEHILIENQYMSKEFHITIIGCEASFYNTQALYGDISGITGGTYEGNSMGVLIKFMLDDVYECRTMLEGNKLYLEFIPVAEMYEKVVVISTMLNDAQTEADILSDVAEKVKTKLDASDVKAYFATVTGEKDGAEEVLELASLVNADFLLGIGVAENAQDVTGYGTEILYNDTFFTTGLNSVTVADKVLREVVTQISGRANGLFPATEKETMIWNAEIPAAYLKAGYISNEQEYALLSMEDYRERIAEGIYQAILKIYEGETE